MQLTNEQNQAYKIAIKPTEKCHKIAGFAGTGKTVILANAAMELDNCDVLAPTNKAAQVLRDRGISQARTIHKALYSPSEKEIYAKDSADNIIYEIDKQGNEFIDEDGNPIPKVLRTELFFNLVSHEENKLPAIALVDESSMLTPTIMEDLLLCYEHVILFGDPFQLPPVRAKDIFDTIKTDVFLDKVYRTALDSPILYYATQIRQNNEPSQIPICKEIFKVTRGNTEIYRYIAEKEAQAICWTNRLRHKINNEVRLQQQHKPNSLNKGENVICLENIRIGKGDDKYLKFYNGEILTVTGNIKEPRDIFESALVKLNNGQLQRVWPFWMKDFFKHYENKIKWNSDVRKRSAGYGNIIFGKLFDYCNCITVHKSQGSEYDKVIIWDQRCEMEFNTSSEMQARWYYTGITRAKNKLGIVI